MPLREDNPTRRLPPALPPSHHGEGTHGCVICGGFKREIYGVDHKGAVGCLYELAARITAIEDKLGIVQPMPQWPGDEEKD